MKFDGKVCVKGCSALFGAPGYMFEWLNGKCRYQELACSLACSGVNISDILEIGEREYKRV